MQTSGAIIILGLVFAEAPIGIVGCITTTIVVVVRLSAGASSGAGILYPSLYLCSIQLICVLTVHEVNILLASCFMEINILLSCRR